MQRSLALGVPGVALAAAGGMWAQMKRAAGAPLPHFDDLDPTGRYGASTGPRIRISVLGDSSITGPGLQDRSHVWMAQLADRLPWYVDLRSYAVGGSRVRDVLLSQAPAAVLDPPDLFVVSVGANDALHATPGGRFSRDLEALLELLRAAAPVVTLGVGNLSVIPRVPLSLRPLLARRSATIDRLHDAVTRGRQRVVRVPVRELTDHHLSKLDHSNFVEDLFHPNRAVHAKWAELFEPYIRNTLSVVRV